MSYLDQWPYPQKTDSYEGDEYRRRHWDEFDTDRRSPPAEEAGRKRRRSTSPYARGRYEPRARYGDEREFIRNRDELNSSRRGQPYGSRDGRRPPLNPYDQDHVVQLRQFAEWFRYNFPEQAQEEDRLDAEAREAASGDNKSRDGIRTRWEKYKRDSLISQVSIMFDFHKKSPWFAEKYDPSDQFVNLRRRVRKQGWQGRLAQFLLELEEGKYDPSMLSSEMVPSGDEEEPSSKGISHSVEHHTKLDGDESKMEEDIPFGGDVEEDGLEADKPDIVLRTPTGEGRKDAVSVFPDGNEIMIRTIPPDIGRLKLEEVCASVPGFVHLALGEPLQKRNFYRAGWIKFNDDADMEKTVQELTEKKIDGFKLHVSHTTRPFVTRVRVAPEVASRPDRLSRDLSQAKELAKVLEAEASSLHLVEDSGLINTQDGVERPENTKPFAEQNPNDVGGHEPRENGSVVLEKRISKVIAEQEARLPNRLEDGLGWEVRKLEITLDFYLAYLRAAYNTCYYCAAVTDHVEELHRKCVKHTRKPLSAKVVQEILAYRKSDVPKVNADMGAEGQEASASNGVVSPEDTSDADKMAEKMAEGREWKRNDEKWIDYFDSKLALLVNRSVVDPREYGGKDYDEELSKACESHVKKEDEGKFRCKQCNKLFKAISFVEKHIANKHPELVKHLEEISYHNNFALDPHRIQPYSHPPPSFGSSAPLPPQAYGLRAANWPQNSDYVHNRGGFYGSHGNAPASQIYSAPPPPYHDHWGHGGYPPAYPPAFDTGAIGRIGDRRLSDRLGGYADFPGHVEGLPAKPVDYSGHAGYRAPPPNIREDPRASGGRKISYHDIDKAAAGDDTTIELDY